jgi:ACS family hexuronate transporter-like MFS transporter
LNAGPGLGAIIAPPLVAWLILTVGWRLAFVVTGLIGLIWLLGWQRFYFKPEEPAHPLPGPDFGFASSNLKSQISSPRSPTPWLHFFRYKAVWGLMLSRFVCDGAFYFFVFWLPKYLSDERGFNIAQIGLFAWIPFLAADLGSLTGGWAGSRLIKHGLTVNASRKTMIWVGAALVPAAFPALYVESAYTALFLIAVAMFAIQIKSSSLFTVPADLFGSHNVASVWGLSGAAGSFGGMLFTPVVGWLVDNISYAPVFVIVSAMHIVSALLVMMLIPRIEPLKESAAIA